MHYAIRVPDAGQNHADIWSPAVLSCLKAAINGPVCESKFCSLMCLTSGRVSQVVPEPELCAVRHHLQRLFLPYVWQIFFARVVAKVLSYLQFEGWKTGAKNWTRWCGLPNKMRKCVSKGVV